MSKAKLFWGIFFISLGLFFLLDLLSQFTYPYIYNLKLFPLVFLFSGILLLKPQKIVYTTVLIILALLVSSMVFSTYKYAKSEKLLPYHYFYKFDDECNFL